MGMVPPLSKLEPTQQRKAVRSQLVRKEVRRQLVRKKLRTHNACVLQRKRLIGVVEIRFGKFEEAYPLPGQNRHSVGFACRWGLFCENGLLPVLPKLPKPPFDPFGSTPGACF
jgi:hypothetical protein